MSEPPRSRSAEAAPQAKRRGFGWWGINSLLFSLIVHALFIAIAIYLVVAHFQKPKHAFFQAAPPSASHNEVEHKVEMARRNNSDSAPPDLKRITTTAVTAITLPDVPEPPVTDDVTPSPMSGVGDTTGLGLGGGGGGGNGNGGGLGLPQVAEQLSKLLFRLPCLDGNRCPLTDDHDLTVHILDPQTHTCNLLVRGVVERKTYLGGTTTKDYLNVGGTPARDVFNIYRLTVDDPPQTYYLNAGESHTPVCVISYTMQITIKDQSKITLHADSIDHAEVRNKKRLSVPDDDPEHPIMVKQPYDGQFIQMDTVSIDD